MSDRNDRDAVNDRLDEDQTTDDLEGVEPRLDEQADAETFADEPFPQGPNEDRSNDAYPPTEAAMPRTSDDDDLDPQGSGLAGTPLRGVYESMARRGDLARRLEDLVRDVEEWARDDGTEQAAWIAETLADAYEQLDTPPEDTDLEPADVEQAEASNLGEPRSTQREP
jgi:hypothetical protein